MGKVKIVVTAIAIKNVADKLVLVKTGDYAITKTGIAQALKDAFVSKYKTAAPAFSVTFLEHVPTKKKGQVALSIDFRKGGFIFGLGGVKYMGDVVVKSM